MSAAGRCPEDAGHRTVPYLTNVSMMDVDFVPDHLLVVGGSYIGLEFGQMYRRFGSRVTIVEMGPRLSGREDQDVSEAVQEILEAEGVEVRLNATCVSGEKEATALRWAWAARKGSRACAGLTFSRRGTRTEHRRPGLEPAGVATDERGYIQVDEALRTTNPRVWALGDCNGKGASRTPRTTTTRSSPTISSPTPAASGPTASRCTRSTPIRRSGARHERGGDPQGGQGAGRQAPDDARPRAVEKGETRGFLKIHVEEGTQRILGAALLGASGRSGALPDRCGVRQDAVHRVSAARAHPPKRQRAIANRDGGPPPAGAGRLDASNRRGPAAIGRGAHRVMTTSGSTVCRRTRARLAGLDPAGHHHRRMVADPKIRRCTTQLSACAVIEGEART